MSEITIRRQLHRRGFIINKSRTRHETLDDYGGYQILSAFNGWIVAGDRHDLDLEDVAAFLDEINAGGGDDDS